ncbi:CYFA0S09e03884g1_1 [Cyberlindnera fabianii]|uniref:cystathionine gamma-lyase n=1 Tax=Cyberlindnera fabianii TaxID=36022 RepID=A0A061AZ05_CYBFA|nr:Cystathionine gamma-lyase [Cyberlindnera fabianii]CDR42452.1 CYFA0S09e03884g1_1 [Cyberlindnera fabianii]
MQFSTRAVHVGSSPDPTTGAVIPAISLSTTFSQNAPGAPIGAYEYSRSSNPNRDNFETVIASLENAKFALAFSSGSAATATILQSLAQGSHVVSVGDVYGGTHRYFTKVANTHGVDTVFAQDIAEELPSLLKPDTRLVWIETPSNPTLSITDIAKVKQIITESGNKDIKLVVDNTFLSPYISNPLNFGADIVVHSATKFINGHSDVVLGVAATNDEQIYQRLTFLQNAIGAIPSPFDSWLAHRGVKTLALRVRTAATSAQKIAEYLEKSEYVQAVNYPGLPTHKGHDIVQKQHRDGLGGGVISFRVKGGQDAASKFTQNTKLFTLAESLGGIESLLEVPAIMTHAGIPVEAREKSGVYDNLVRLSVGIEDVEDLIADIEQALKASQ